METARSQHRVVKKLDKLPQIISSKQIEEKFAGADLNVLSKSWRSLRKCTKDIR